MMQMEKPRFRVTTRGDVRAITPSAQALLGGSNQTRDAARHDVSEFSGWRPALRFAGSVGQGNWETITGRSRDLDENNGWINGGLDRRVESVIGVNIRLSAQPKHELLNRDYEWRMGWTADVQSRFDVWANDIDHRCDARMEFTFGALARLAYLTYVRDGEAYAEIRDNERGLRNTTNILLIEPERISTPPTLRAAEGPQLRDGIARDSNGAVTGYWVQARHPADTTPTFEQQRWEYIPARGKTGRAKMVRVFSPRRVEQNRGISRLAEIMVPAKMADRYDRAEVAAALKSAVFSLFIKSPGTTEDLEAALAPASDDDLLDPWIQSYLDERTKRPVMVEAAQVNHLLPGEDVVTPQSSHPNSNYPNFMRTILQKVAGSLGVSYPQLSQDWAGINYSSARALLNEMWRAFQEDRRFFTQHFLTPIYAAWLEVEVAMGDVKVPGGPSNFYRQKTAICLAEWIGPGRGSVDPLKEANANNLDIAAGRKSTVSAILEDGRDPADVMSEEQWFLDERRKRGLGPVNNNVKPDASGGSDAESAAGGTEQDRDGDGKPMENQTKRKPGNGGPTE